MLSMVASVHNVDKPILQSKVKMCKNCALAVRKFILPNLGNFLKKSSGITCEKLNIFIWLGTGKGCPKQG
jgi:hypothetical protein